MCFRNNPEEIYYDQRKMRHHLKTCLQASAFRVFPRTTCDSTCLPRPTRIKKKLKLYCICKMPEAFDEKMICCDHCGKWYHYSCMKLRVSENPKNWRCCSCGKRSIKCHSFFCMLLYPYTLVFVCSLFLYETESYSCGKHYFFLLHAFVPIYFCVCVFTILV